MKKKRPPSPCPWGYEEDRERDLRHFARHRIVRVAGLGVVDARLGFVRLYLSDAPRATEAETLIVLRALLVQTGVTEVDVFTSRGFKKTIFLYPEKRSCGSDQADVPSSSSDG